MYNCCLKGTQLLSGIPYLLASRECPQEKDFSREHCRVFPVFRLSFCEGKNLLKNLFLHLGTSFLFLTKNSNDPDFLSELDFNKETHSEFLQFS